MAAQTAGRAEILAMIEEASSSAMDHIAANAPGPVDRELLEQNWNSRPPPRSDVPVKQAIQHCYAATISAAGIDPPPEPWKANSWKDVVSHGWNQAMREMAAQAITEATQRFEAEDDETAVELTVRATRISVAYLASLPGYAHGDDRDLLNATQPLARDPGNDGAVAKPSLAAMEKLLQNLQEHGAHNREETRTSARMLCAVRR